MKYLPLPATDIITNSLNFDTLDCHVTGGCDIYTTKAAGSDKKLYKNIENSLRSQYASILSFHAALPPSQHQQATQSLNLSRTTPFGSLSQVSSRRTFAYLVATLNASHPEYDFSHLLRPSDFQREVSSKKILMTLNTTLENLRPANSTSVADDRLSASNIPSTPTGAGKWNPQLWATLEKEMQFQNCSVYSYSPEDDPFSESEDEVALWSHHYFFFNKDKKRVCYIYLRGLSMLGNETPGAKTPTSIMTVRTKRPASGSWSLSEEDTGRKRARFWLGDRADRAIVVADDDEGDDDLQILGEKPDALEGEESDRQYFERLSETASASPCEDRRRDRSSSSKRSRSKESLQAGATE